MHPLRNTLLRVAFVVVVLCGADSASGQTIGFDSLAAVRDADGRVTYTVTSVAPDFSASATELPSVIGTDVLPLENKDGTVNCTRTSLFYLHLLKDIATEPFALAAAGGSLTLAILQFRPESTTPPSEAVMGEIITPVPESATILLGCISLMGIGIATLRLRRKAGESDETH